MAGSKRSGSSALAAERSAFRDDRTPSEWSIVTLTRSVTSPVSRRRRAPRSTARRTSDNTTASSFVSGTRTASSRTTAASSRVVTGEASIPRARRQRSIPNGPNATVSCSRESAARSPTCRTLSSSRCVIAFGPIPGRIDTRNGARKRSSSPGRTSRIPASFATREATFATSLFAATPIAGSSRTRSASSRLIRAAASIGGPKRRPVPVMSR